MKRASGNPSTRHNTVATIESATVRRRITPYSGSNRRMKFSVVHSFVTPPYAPRESRLYARMIAIGAKNSNARTDPVGARNQRRSFMTVS